MSGEKILEEKQVLAVYAGEWGEFLLLQREMLGTAWGAGREGVQKPRLFQGWVHAISAAACLRGQESRGNILLNFFLLSL